MAGARSYSAGHYILSLDGEPSLVKDFDGGNIKAEVVTHKMGPNKFDVKAISNVKFEPFTINIGMSMGKNLYEWIKASMDNQHMRKNGYIAAANFDKKAMAYRHFRDALITEVTIPACDGSSKDSSYFTIKFDAEEITYQDGDQADLKGAVNTKQKRWLNSNFRLTLGDLPTARVSKIDSFTLKQGVVQDDVGQFRVSTKEPTKMEVPNLKVTFSAADVKPWAQWFDNFVIKGLNTDSDELQGAIEFLDPSGKETLGTVELQNVGIFSLNAEKLEAGKDGIHRYVAELYVEQMRLDLAYV